MHDLPLATNTLKAALIVCLFLCCHNNAPAQRDSPQKKASAFIVAGPDLYVSPAGSDSNRGTATAPWKTLQHAADMVKPGAVVHVAPGTYGAVNSMKNGTASARIRFISDAKWAAKLRSSGTDTVWTNSGNYVDIVGFDISGDVRIGLLNNASFARIIANNVHDIRGSCSSDGGAGIDNAEYKESDNDIIGNVVHDIGNPDVQCYTVQGIYHSNPRGHIWNNISYRNAAWGIHLWHAAKDVVVTNNLVFHNGEGGILVGAGDAPGGVTASGITVVNNIIMDHQSSWGAGLAICETGLTDATNYYVNNLIWKNRQGITLHKGLHDVNTLNADPGLVNYQPDGSGDYHLKQGSRAINSGTPHGVPTIDFDGAARSPTRQPDIGPFAFGSNGSGWPWM